MKQKIFSMLIIVVFMILGYQPSSYAFSTEINKRLDKAIVLFTGIPKAYINNYETQIDFI